MNSIIMVYDLLSFRISPVRYLNDSEQCQQPDVIDPIK
jgi:hypothetical protein